MADKKRGLGRGLDQLLSSSDWLKRDDIQLFYCDINRLIPNPYQPRQIVDDPMMDGLVQSIREKGILQPILVTRAGMDDQYQIIAGERRWQAAERAGLTEVPVVLRETTSADALELALIENIQRRDLNCIEEAHAYLRLQEEFHVTQEQIAQRVGKNRSTIANLVRLLQLPSEIQEQILNEHITMGHARALLAVADPGEQLRLCKVIIERQLSVRQTEDLVSKKDRPAPNRTRLEPRWQQIQESLQSRLDTPVVLRRRGKRGTITISFRSDEELELLAQRLGLTTP